MKQKSIWLNEINSNSLDSLNKNITCNILIIGGGMAGMNVALNLLDEDDVVLIDKGKVGYGVTSHTTGKLTYLQGTMYRDIMKAYNFDVARDYLNSQRDAIDMALSNIRKYNIDCDLEKSDSYLFTTSDNGNLNREREFLTKCQIKYEDAKLPIKIPFVDAFKVTDTYVFHPLKYIMGIKNVVKDNIKIYENTKAFDLDIKDDYYLVKTEKGSIKAKKLVIATHYPFFIIPGLMPIKLGLEQSYAMSAKSENGKFNAINVDEDVYSIRFYKDNIIVGGFSHALSENIDYKGEEDKLLNFYNTYFENPINEVWMTHDLKAHDYLPMMGRLDNSNLLIVTAFNKWGMTNGILSGKIISDLIKGKKNKYESLFKINRSFSLEKAKNFTTDNFKIGKVYIESKLNKNKDFYNKVYVENIDGISCGIYVDEKGNKHIVRNTCPHFKCSLIFNNADKTWDCPCHGSRFDIDGNLIEGPSVFSIKINED